MIILHTWSLQVMETKTGIPILIAVIILELFVHSGVDAEIDSVKTSWHVRQYYIRYPSIIRQYILKIS